MDAFNKFIGLNIVDHKAMVIQMLTEIIEKLIDQGHNNPLLDIKQCKVELDDDPPDAHFAYLMTENLYFQVDSRKA